MADILRSPGYRSDNDNSPLRWQRRTIAHDEQVPQWWRHVYFLEVRKDASGNETGLAYCSESGFPPRKDGPWDWEADSFRYEKYGVPWDAGRLWEEVLSTEDLDAFSSYSELGARWESPDWVYLLWERRGKEIRWHSRECQQDPTCHEQECLCCGRLLVEKRPA